MHQRLARRSLPSMGFKLEIQTASHAYNKSELTLSPNLKKSPATQHSFGCVKSPETPLPKQSPTTFSHNCDCIIDNHLYLGNEESSLNKQTLQKHKIKKVLNVSHDCQTPDELYKELGIEHKHIMIRDHSDAPMKDHIEDMIMFIHTAIKNKEPILVHCKKGWSRSATVVIAYIIMYGRPLHKEVKASYNDALNFVGSKRTEIQPNLGFCMFLNDLSIACGFPDSFFNDK
jgi:dual specificity phosphatase 3